MKKLLLTALLMFAAAALARSTVVTTIHPYYDLTRQIAGEYAEVIRILRPGASPHTFDPTPRDVGRIAQADLVVMNGGVGLDEWLLDLLDASGTDAPVLILFDALEFDGIEVDHDHLHDHEHDHDHEHANGHKNPHIWLDPVLMLDAVPLIAQALGEMDEANAEAYQANAETLIAALEALHEELTETLAPLEGEALVPFHDAWPYFARRYGLDLIVEIEPFPGREPSPAYLRYALGLIEGSNARAIFNEPQLSRRPAEVVAESAGLPLYEIDPLGGTSETDSYQDLMRHNAQVLLDALAGE